MILFAGVVPLLAGLFLLLMERFEAVALVPRDADPVRAGPREAPSADRMASGFDLGRALLSVSSGVSDLQPTASLRAQSGGWLLLPTDTPRPHHHGGEAVNHRTDSAVD